MCLEFVTKVVTLKKDLKVYKIFLKDKYLKSGQFYGKKVKTGLNVVGKNCREYIYTEFTTSPSTTSTYNAGFHCYSNKTNKRSLKGIIITGRRGLVLVKITVPKYTEVTYGKQDRKTVIVTPRFIFKKEDIIKIYKGEIENE